MVKDSESGPRRDHPTAFHSVLGLIIFSDMNKTVSGKWHLYLVSHENWESQASVVSLWFVLQRMLKCVWGSSNPPLFIEWFILIYLCLGSPPLPLLERDSERLSDYIISGGVCFEKHWSTCKTWTIWDPSRCSSIIQHKSRIQRILNLNSVSVSYFLTHLWFRLWKFLKEFVFVHYMVVSELKGTILSWIGLQMTFQQVHYSGWNKHLCPK